MIQLYQNLDLRPIGIPQTLRLSQYDSDFEIVFKLDNFDGTWILDTGTTAEIQGTKTDGHGYSADAVFDSTELTVTIAGDVQMTAAAGRNVFEVVLFHDGDRLGSKNFVLDVERAALDAETTQSDSQIKNFTEMVEAAEDAAETATAAAATFSTDTTLSIAGKAADAKATGDAIAAVDAEVEDVRIGTDGTVYSSAGDAVRDQYTELKGDLTSINTAVNGAKNYTEGYYIDRYGVLQADSDYCVTDKITVPASTSITFSYEENATNVRLVAFSSDDTAVNYWGGSGVSRTITTTAVTSYVRFSYLKGKTATLAVSGTTTYTAQITETGLVRDVSALDTEITALQTKVVTPYDTSFFHVSKNLVDPTALVTGELVIQTNGNFSPSSGHTRTGYIEIEPSTQYVVRRLSGTVGSNFRYAFYTSEKTFISGAVGSIADMLLTSPATAKYIAVSNSSGGMNIMIAPYVDGDTSFEAYDNTYVLPKYIIDGDADSIILNVPEKIYAHVGYETNVYFDNITEKSDLYTWDVTCTKGMQLERGYRVTPTSDDVGTYTLTIKASISDNVYKEVTTSLIISSVDAGAGETKTVIIMGDSTTYNGIAVTKLNENFAEDDMSISTIGTMGTAPNNHEGRSGWSMDDYFTKASITYPEGDSRGTIYNPFYNPTSETFDAEYYFTNSGIAIPDFFVINMGINDVFSYATDTALETAMTTILERMESAVQSVLNATTTTKVCVCLTIPPNHSQDAFGKAYACSQTRDRYKRNNALWVKKLIDTYADREDERIYLIAINACLDTIYNMGLETLPVNARNMDVTYQSPIANGGVHPVASGYWQIADVYTAFLKANV